MAVLAVLTAWIVHDDVADVPSVVVEVIGTTTPTHAFQLLNDLVKKARAALAEGKPTAVCSTEPCRLLARILGQELIADRHIAAPRIHRRLAAIQRSQTPLDCNLVTGRGELIADGVALHAR